MSARVRVLFYLHTAQFALSMSLLRELSQLADVHVLLEVSPSAWRQESFELTQQQLPSGIVPADPVLASHFPEGVRAYWSGLASFNLVVHHTPKSLEPHTWRVGHTVARFIRRLEPDVIHFDEGSRRMLLALFELGRTPMVLTIHDPELHSGERHWQSELYRFFFVRRAARILLYNAASRLGFAKHYSVPAQHVRPMHLGVHHIFREWAVGPLGNSGRTVLFYGRLAAYKGLDVLFKAAPLVAERVPGLHIVVAGRSVAGYRLPAPPDGARVEVIGDYLSNTHLAQLVADARVVVCPYVDATQSGVVLTAFGFGKPVVATRVGGLPEYVQDGQTGLLVPPGDPVALARALIELLTTPALEDKLRKEVAQLGRGGRLDWATTARDTLTLYEEVVLR